VSKNLKIKIGEIYEKNLSVSPVKKTKSENNFNNAFSNLTNNNPNNLNINNNSNNIYSQSDYQNYLKINKVTGNVFNPIPNTMDSPNFNFSTMNIADKIQITSNKIEQVIPQVIRKNYEIFNQMPNPISTNQYVSSATNQTVQTIHNQDSPTLFNLNKNLSPNMNFPVMNNLPLNNIMKNIPSNHVNNFNNIVISSQITNENYLDYTDDQLIENAYFFAKDQCLCRHLQKKINENPQMARDIFISLKSKMLELILDPFGNYLVQKLVDNIEDSKIAWLIDCVTPSFLDVCSSSHGTRVIQKLIENLKTEILFNKFKIIFTQHLMKICKDVNANHIVHKYISIIKSPYNNFVYEMMLNNIDEIAKDKHGCCVVQKCLECADPIQKVKLT
jgi:hypothetical protein